MADVIAVKDAPTKVKTAKYKDQSTKTVFLKNENLPKMQPHLH